MSMVYTFYPMLCLVAWTFVIMLFMGYKRFSAAFAGRVKAGHFKMGESELVPPDVRVANRNFVNLLEAPVLFYVLTLALYVTHLASDGLMVLAWTYVGLRVVHSVIHVTYNHVLHRFAAYAASNVVLAVMWIAFAVSLHQPSRFWPFG